MIAQRLRPLGWIAAVALAAIVFYLVSLRVAAERGALEAVDRQILVAQNDIRRLQTEFGTRASLRQLERWNGDVLALTAPTASQYLDGEMALASLDSGSTFDALDKGKASVQTAMVSAQQRPTVPAAPTAREPVFTPAIVTIDKDESAAPERRVERASMIQTVAYTPGTSGAEQPRAARRSQRVAMLDDGTLGDITRRAAREAGDSGR
jgi:hypothetical protein